MTNKYTQKVQRGIEFLDENEPGWRQWIEIESLNLGDCEACILGQLFGTFDLGIGHYGLSCEKEEILGFNMWGNQNNEDWQQLTQAWKDALTKPVDL